MEIVKVIHNFLPVLLVSSTSLLLFPHCDPKYLNSHVFAPRAFEQTLIKYWNSLEWLHQIFWKSVVLDTELQGLYAVCVLCVCVCDPDSLVSSQQSAPVYKHFHCSIPPLQPPSQKLHCCLKADFSTESQKFVSVQFSDVNRTLEPSSNNDQIS